MTTIQDWLDTAQDLESLERELLVSHVLSMTRAQILTRKDLPLEPAQRTALDHLLDKRRQGQPYAYLVGEQEFWSLPFRVTQDVLIPRPETELLVELVSTRAERGASVLDLGTGSGAIAVALAHERKDLRVTATDISPAALDIARQNSTRHHTSVTFVKSNWFDELSGRWDIIVSNPPYIAENDPHLQGLAWEPQSALVSGDGLAAIRDIVRNAPDHLSNRGQIFIEHGYDQALAVAGLLRDRGFAEVAAHTDLAGILRVTSAEWTAS